MLVSTLLVFGADLANCIVPAVIPVNARLAIDYGPCPVTRAESLARFAVRLKRNKEMSSAEGANTNFPFTNKTISTEWQVFRRGGKLNARDLRHVLLMPIFEDHHRPGLEFDTRDFIEGDILLVTIIEGDGERDWFSGSRRTLC